MRILLVEPDEYYHAKFADLLGANHEVMIAADAITARWLLVDFRPDVIVLELLLAGSGSGYELLDEIRTKFNRSNLPVIIYSRVKHSQDVAAAIERGAMAYFVKGQDRPADVSELVHKLSY